MAISEAFEVKISANLTEDDLNGKIEDKDGGHIRHRRFDYRIILKKKQLFDYSKMTNQ